MSYKGSREQFVANSTIKSNGKRRSYATILTFKTFAIHPQTPSLYLHNSHNKQLLFQYFIFNGKKSIYCVAKIEFLFRDNLRNLLSKKHCFRKERAIVMYRKIPGLNFYPGRRLPSLTNFVVVFRNPK